MSRESLKESILSSDVVDPVGVHHQFKNEMHGRKIDLEEFMRNPAQLSKVVVETTIFIQDNYDRQPELLVSVANGTNDLVRLVARDLGCEVNPMLTKKTESGLALTDGAKQALDDKLPKFALVLEDVGSTGSSSGAVANLLLDRDVERVEVLNVVQRTSELIQLVGAGIVYKSVVVCFEEIKTFHPDYCDHCRDGWQLIEYGK